MGLPIWRNPDEQRNKSMKKGTARDALRSDPTAAPRSPIRRSALRERDASRVRSYSSALRQSPLDGGIGGRLPSVTTLLETVDRDPSTRNRTSRWSDSSRRAQAEARLAFHEQSLRDMREATAAGFERVQASRNQNALNSSGPASRRTMRDHIEANTNARRPLEEAPARDTTARPHGRPRLEFEIHTYRGSNRSSLPTPPSGNDENDSDDHVDEHSIDSRSAAEGVLPYLVRSTGNEIRRMNHSTHPLSRSWRPTSPSAGRSSESSSPTSENTADAWEVMQSTIAPDETLPSTDSSFTSTVVSNEFSTRGAPTTNTTPATSFNDDDDAHHASDQEFTRSGSVPSPADALPPLVCDDEDESTDDMELATEALAEEMFRMESHSAQGLRRIALHQAQREAEGHNRYAWPDESEQAEIGLRLIDHAFTTTDGTARVVEAQNTLLSRDGVMGYLEHRRDPRIDAPLGSASTAPRYRSSESSQVRQLRRIANRRRPGPLNSHPVSEMRETANDDGGESMVFDGRRMGGPPAAPQRNQSRQARLIRPVISTSALRQVSDDTTERPENTSATTVGHSGDSNPPGHLRAVSTILAHQEAGEEVPVELWHALARTNNGTSDHTRDIALITAELMRRASRIVTPPASVPGHGLTALRDALHRVQDPANHHQMGAVIRREDGTQPAMGPIGSGGNHHQMRVVIRRQDGTQPAMGVMDAVSSGATGAISSGDNHHQRRNAIRREDGTQPAMGAISSTPGLRLRGGG